MSSGACACGGTYDTNVLLHAPGLLGETELLSLEVLLLVDGRSRIRPDGVLDGYPSRGPQRQRSKHLAGDKLHSRNLHLVLPGTTTMPAPTLAATAAAVTVAAVAVSTLALSRHRKSTPAATAPRPAKTPHDTSLQSSYKITSADCEDGRMYGGALLKLLDVAAGTVAAKHSCSPCLTVSAEYVLCHSCLELTAP